MSIFIFKGVD